MTAPPSPIPASLSVLLVDDHAVVRTGARQLLESWGGFTVTEAATIAETLRLVTEAPPALVILDINLPDGSGLDLIPRLLALHPPLRLLIFTMHEEAGFAARAMTAGAHGFVTKGDAPEIIVEAALKVGNGEIYLSQTIAQKLALSRVAPTEDPLAALTRREREVLRLFGQGKTLAEIASVLGVSYKTTANCCSQIKTKLDLNSNAELMRLAIQTPKD